MYHAVMEEVARFLERCYQSIDLIQKNNQMARSKSTMTVFESLQPQNSSPLKQQQPQQTNEIDQQEIRLRNSANAMEMPNINNNDSQLSNGVGKQLNESFTSSTTTTSTETFNTYSDFTW